MITDIFTIILQVIIPMAIVIGLLLQAIKITKKMSGEAGALAIKYAKTFAAGPIARNTIGRAASLIGKSEIAKNTLGSKWGRRFGGRYISQGLKTVESESFGGAKGGYKGAMEGKAKKQEEFGKYLGEGDATAGAARQEAYAKSLASGKAVAQYTGIGAAAQKAAPAVDKMQTKTAKKAERETNYKNAQKVIVETKEDPQEGEKIKSLIKAQEMSNDFIKQSETEFDSKKRKELEERADNIIKNIIPDIKKSISKDRLETLSMAQKIISGYEKQKAQTEEFDDAQNNLEKLIKKIIKKETKEEPEEEPEEKP